VRTALGASRLRLVRQMLAESLVLACCGGAGGLLVANWGLAVLRARFDIGASYMDRARIDGRVLAFAVVASLLSTIVFGLIPALHGARADVNQTLRDGSRATGTPRAHRLRSLLVAGEVAAAVLLLVVATLFLRTLGAIQRIEAEGFDPGHVLTLRVSLPEARYADGAAVTAFYEGVIDRLRSSPDVMDAGAGVRVPAAGSRYNPNRSVVIEGRPVQPDETLSAQDQTVMPGYLETLRIPLRAGRYLTRSDGAGAPLAVVISDTMARKYWGGASPIGSRIRLGDETSKDAWRTVVGVVGNVRNDDIDAPPVPQVYVPLAQRLRREMTIVLRTRGDPLEHVATARAAVEAIDADQPVYDVKPMEQILEEDLRDSVVVIAMASIFAAVALALAAIGIYGVVAQSVAQRTHEIGVRMALGAAVSDVFGLVVRQGLLPGVAGLALGIGGGLATARVFAGMLYGVTPTDPITYASAIALLVAVALVACMAPARRAARVDPLVALRYE
jgi:putative ABC transport system permease protein